MKNVLVTGGTVFVSRYVAEYYVRKGFHVFVLNRGTGKQPEGVTWICADRGNIGDKLREYHFDVIFDITAYTKDDVNNLLDAVETYDDYILISSSAVYPDNEKQPFCEETPLGANKFWGKYGTDKIEAENALLERNPDAYILRPPYLYGKYNNVYREAFVFDCALSDRKFYLPQDGSMKLQFFHVDDLCRFMDAILDKRPDRHIFNVGNEESISIKDWVKNCYEALGKDADFINVDRSVEQRNYFSFYNYEYCLDVGEQTKLMPKTKDFFEGIKETLEWYMENQADVRKKPFMEYIEKHL